MTSLREAIFFNAKRIFGNIVSLKFAGISQSVLNLSVLFMIVTLVACFTPILYKEEEIRSEQKIPLPFTVFVFLYSSTYLFVKSGKSHKRTYVGWVTKKGDIFVGGIDHNLQKILPEVLIKAKLQKDDHANPSLLILKVSLCKTLHQTTEFTIKNQYKYLMRLYFFQNDHIVIFYSAHNGKNMYYKISTHPEDITSWSVGKKRIINHQK